jgi:two-component system chemotaxis response regulator CheB
MTTAKPVRVLVVDDSAFARKVLRESLGGHPRIEVVGTARDGLEALERIADLTPDVVTLDLVMPNLDGLGVLAALPPAGGPRVVVVTTQDSSSDLAIAALEAGAVDFVHKPTSLATDRLSELSAELVEKVLVAADAASRRPLEVARRAILAARPARTRIVVIGTSTGGPQALSRLLPALPRALPVPVVVALHIPAGYTEALSARLNEASEVDVMEALADETPLRAGLVVIARGGEHLTMAHRAGAVVARVDRTLVGSLHTPSVDHLFQAAAREFGDGVLAVVLTGMGTDGLEGARAIRRAGGAVLVESPLSTVVYGMPRAVKEAGLATEEARLDLMAERIAAHL